MIEDSAPVVVGFDLDSLTLQTFERVDEGLIDCRVSGQFREPPRFDWPRLREHVTRRLVGSYYAHVRVDHQQAFPHFIEGDIKQLRREFLDALARFPCQSIRSSIALQREPDERGDNQ